MEFGAVGAEQWVGKKIKEWPRGLPPHQPFLGSNVHRIRVPGEDGKFSGPV